MTENINYKCDWCGKEIDSEHSRLFMVTATVEGYSYRYDAGGADWKEVLHFHNDLSKQCWYEVRAQVFNHRKIKSRKSNQERQISHGKEEEKNKG